MRGAIIFLFLATTLMAANENYEETVITDAPSSQEDRVMVQDSDEDTKSIVEDYIKNDEQLKGSFFIKDNKSNKVLSLKYLTIFSVETVSETEKRVKAQFTDTSTGKLRNVFFFVRGSSWGSLDIERIDLEQPTEIKNLENKGESKSTADKKSSVVLKDKKNK